MTSHFDPQEYKNKWARENYSTAQRDAKSQRYKQQSTDSYLLGLAKGRARDKGLEFNIERSDIIVPTHCPMLGVELKTDNRNNSFDSSPTIDRIDPKKGYIKGNIQVVSYRANRLKGDATVEELEKVIAYMKQAR